jgi:hypothetical protein
MYTIKSELLIPYHKVSSYPLIMCWSLMTQAPRTWESNCELIDERISGRSSYTVCCVFNTCLFQRIIVDVCGCNTVEGMAINRLKGKKVPPKSR